MIGTFLLLKVFKIRTSEFCYKAVVVVIEVVEIVVEIVVVVVVKVVVDVVVVKARDQQILQEFECLIKPLLTSTR